MCAPESSDRPTASASSCRTVSAICSGRLVQPGVDDLEPAVAQRPGDDLGAPIVTVEAGLRDDDSVPALHAGRTIADGVREPRPTWRRTLPSWTRRLDSWPAGNTHAVPARPAAASLATSSCSSAPAIAVLLGGIVIAAAILAITARGTGRRTSSGRSRSGSEVDIHDRVRTGGPVNIAGPERRRRLLGRDRGPPARRAPGEAAEAARAARCAGAARRTPSPATTSRSRAATWPASGASPAQTRATKGAFMVALRDVEPAPDGPPGTGG